MIFFHTTTYTSVSTFIESMHKVNSVYLNLIYKTNKTQIKKNCHKPRFLKCSSVCCSFMYAFCVLHFYLQIKEKLDTQYFSLVLLLEQQTKVEKVKRFSLICNMSILWFFFLLFSCYFYLFFLYCVCVSECVNVLEVYTNKGQWRQQKLRYEVNPTRLFIQLNQCISSDYKERRLVSFILSTSYKTNPERYLLFLVPLKVFTCDYGVISNKHPFHFFSKIILFLINLHTHIYSFHHHHRHAERIIINMSGHQDARILVTRRSSVLF